MGDGHDFYVPNSEHHNSWYLPAGHGSSYINPAEARLWLITSSELYRWTHKGKNKQSYVKVSLPDASDT